TRGGHDGRGDRAEAHRRCVGPRRSRRQSLLPLLYPSPPRPNPAETRSLEFRRGRGGLPDRDRLRPTPERPQSRPASGACTRQTPPIDRPSGGSARRPRARARRLFPDAGDAGNRRGDVAVSVVGVGLLWAESAPTVVAHGMPAIDVYRTSRVATANVAGRTVSGHRPGPSGGREVPMSLVRHPTRPSGDSRAPSTAK